MPNKIIICPGFHPVELTESFLSELNITEAVVFPTQEYPAYSAVDVFQYLKKSVGTPNNAPPVLFISFSAGVVGAIGAAIAWVAQGGTVEAFFAFDGWGVPLTGNFPIYRLSHDYFTDWSSALLGAGQNSFYADPSVEHLDLWRSPASCWGWWVKSPGCRVRCSAVQFITDNLKKD